MDRSYFDDYTKILISELKPALGCTEPVAIAFASASACDALEAIPDRIDISCSGNLIKNVKSVTVPNSGGMKGIEAAAILGALGGTASLRLEVLSTVNDDVRAKTKDLLKTPYCRVTLAEDIPGLYVKVTVYKGEDSAEATLVECHDELYSLKKNGVLIKEKKDGDITAEDVEKLKDELNLSNILSYAKHVDLEDIKEVLSRQIRLNKAIAEEGLRRNYGCSIGKTLKKLYDWDDVRIRARAYASAGSDARMSGCSLPVVINSGSGNQGLTVSLPIIEYGEYLGSKEEEIYRALALSNLTAIHQKKYIGPLSAYCGAVSASAGAAAGIAFLMGGSEREIAAAVSNTLATVGGIVCDGAKASCAAKISTSLEAAILAMEMSMEERRAFESGDGLVKKDIERTIKAFGKMGKEGMRETDKEILSLMLED